MGAGGLPSYGLPRSSTATRIGQLEEGLQIVKTLWKDGRVSWDGRFYKVENAICDPLPIQKPHTPITIAAKRTKMLKLTARYADIWEGLFPPGDVLQ